MSPHLQNRVLNIDHRDRIWLIRVWLILSAIVSISMIVKGQQDPQFSQNMFNLNYVNPGYAGSSGDINATVINRNQWVGFEGAPVTTIVSADIPMKIIGSNDGISLNMMLDDIGDYSNILYKLGYAYRANIMGGSLGVGISLGIFNKQITPSWDNDYDSGDPLIPTTSQNALVFDNDLGFFFIRNSYYLCLSVTHLTEPKIDYGEGLLITLNRHYYLSAGYRYKTLNPDISLEPSIFIKSDGSSSQFDINGLLKYRDKYWGGLSYRLQDAVVIMIGVTLAKDIKLGYSYDITTSQIAQVSDGSHEIMVSYSTPFRVKKRATKHKSIRYL